MRRAPSFRVFSGERVGTHGSQLSISTSASNSGATLPPLTTARPFDRQATPQRGRATPPPLPLRWLGTSRVAATIARMAARIPPPSRNDPVHKSLNVGKVAHPHALRAQAVGDCPAGQLGSHSTILPVRKLSAVSPASSGSTPKTFAWAATASPPRLFRSTDRRPKRRQHQVHIGHLFGNLEAAGRCPAMICSSS